MDTLSDCETLAPSVPAKVTVNFAPSLTILRISLSKTYLAFIRSCGARSFVASSQKRRSLLTSCAPRRWLISQNSGRARVPGNGCLLRPRLWAGSGSQARWGGLSSEIAKPIKTVPQSTLVGSSALEHATIPPQKDVLAKKQQGQKNRHQKA